MIFRFLLPQVTVYQIKYCEKYLKFKGKRIVQKIGLWMKRIDANRPDNNSLTYQIVSLARFLHRLRLSPEERNLPDLRLLVKPKLNKF